MRRRDRPFLTGILNHCYQRTVDGGLLFYCYSDYLVWFTIICTVAKKHSVLILAMCPMPDHVHLTVVAYSRKDLASFMAEYTRLFSAVHNKVCHCKGQLFQRPFGSAVKKGAKAARTNLVYVGNNPVERQLALKAEDYRWTFLAYYGSGHPYSERLIVRNSRWPLRKAVGEVKEEHKSNRPLKYAQLRRMFQPLDKKESLQLTDFIISTYNVIDYPAAIRFFGGFQDMLTAMHANTGSEYDLNEPFVGKSDEYYAQMANIVMNRLRPADIHDILAFSDEEKRNVFKLLRKQTKASPEQIAKFLRLREMETADR